MRKVYILGIALISSLSLFSQATKPAGELATIIADRIITETPYTFVNSKTKDIYTNLKGVPVSQDIKVSNEYNEWHYTNGVLQIALLELADRPTIKNMRIMYKKT